MKIEINDELWNNFSNMCCVDKKGALDKLSATIKHEILNECARQDNNVYHKSREYAGEPVSFVYDKVKSLF